MANVVSALTNPGVWLMVLNSLVVAGSSACFKAGAGTLQLGQARAWWLNGWVWLGLALAPLTFVLNVTAYRYADISQLHPLMQLALIWSAIFGVALFGETLSRRTLLGTVLVLLGAVLITLS